MTLVDLRILIMRPFNQYAVFSGRSGRAEFWLFVLTFIVFTEMAWIAGFSAMKLAGFDSHHHNTEHHNHYSYSQDGDGTEGDKHLDDFDGEDGNPFTFKLHRHQGDEDYHLHGSFAPPKKRGWYMKDEDDADRNFRFHMDFDDSTNAEDGADAFQGFVALALLIPLLAVGARRLHDSGKSGWWQLFVLIPLAGWLVLAIFFIVSGDPKKNRFGAPPG